MTHSGARTRSHRIGPTGVLMVGLISMWSLHAAGEVTRPEDIQATFLYNFAKFVEWPERGSGDAVAPFRIEIIGRDPFDGRFDQLMIGKKMDDQPIEVIHSLAAPSATPVRVVFVSASEGKRLDSLLNTYRRNHVLTVSDIPDFTQRGGMIGFVAEAGAVRFRINQSAVELSQLRVSSRLLALGR
jgi:YfiR/HmsC-like